MRTAIVLLLVIAAVAAPVPAWAEPSSSDTANVNVGPIASGPAVGQGSAGFDGSGTRAQASSRTGQPATPPPASAGTGGADVTFGPIPYNAIPVAGPPQVYQSGIIQVPPAVPASACPPGQTGYYAYDPNGAITGIVCVGSQAGAPPGAAPPSPVALAAQASAMQPWPVLQVTVNPAVGLTGLASWFWLAGSPAMPDATATAGPLTVLVHAALIDVAWDFGDGTGLSSGTDVGRAFPASSGIQHVYQTDTDGRPSGLPVSALVRYRVTYSVNGGPFADLGVKARSYRTSYEVNQLQPEAVSVR